MFEYNPLDKERERKRGSFVDITDTLLPLFSDPDARSHRRWLEVFGEAETAVPAKHGGRRFSGRAKQKLLSGS